MNKKINKIFSLTLIAIITTSFTGCLNLSDKPKEEPVIINNHQGVFKSVDGGKTWEHKVDVKEGGLLDKTKIASMAMDPQDNKVLYLGTRKDGLYKSENSADSWKKVIDENEILSETATIYDIAIENGNSNIIYIATLNNNSGELLKSEDGGKKWKRSHIIDKPKESVNTVKIDSIAKNIIYLGTSQGGLLKSQNRGMTWVTLSWFESSVENVLVDFHNNMGIIVRTKNEVTKSTNGGNEWETLNKGIIKTSGVKVDFKKVSTMVMDDVNPLVAYMTYLNLILITRDGGLTWEKLNTITPSRTAIGTIPQVKQVGLNRNILYYGAGNVIYKSEDKGISWSSSVIPIIGDVRYTVSDYVDPDVIYVGSFYDPPPPPKKKGIFGMFVLTRKT
ncbi:hypothetical protein KAT63_02290 [Candidatus Parcubacteria bacterium]|nr:hypothetical protein [Candidatus Parcubacteria bacterium]